MARRMLITSVLFLLAAAPAWADDKVDVKKLKGKWEREIDNNKLVFDFQDEKTMKCKITPSGSTDSLEVNCDYKLADDGVVSLTIVKVVNKVEGLDGPQKDDSFSFKVEMSKDKMTISELKGSKVDDTVKTIVEGEYRKVK